MQVDIYITETEGSKEIQIPWLPDSVQFETSEARVVKYEVLDLGEVIVPSGNNLEGFSWESYLPGAGHKDLPFLRGSWTEPKNIENTLTKWKKEGTKLRLMMTGSPVNHDVYLIDFVPVYFGGAGDVSYSIKFSARRDPVITSQKVAASSNSSSSNSNNSSSNSTRKTNPETYTVQKGDTLWGIAQKYLGGGKNYTQLYSLNKTIIEETAKKYGKKSSNGGHWIYPGTRLALA